MKKPGKSSSNDKTEDTDIPSDNSSNNGHSIHEGMDHGHMDHHPHDHLNPPVQ